MKSKIFAIFFIFLMMTCFSTQFVKADFLNDALSSGGEFWNMGKDNPDDFGEQINNKIWKYGDSSMDLIGVFKLIGNLVFFIVSIALGIKYIFSGIDGKASVKETLPSFVIGIVFFYLAETLVDFFSGIGGDIQNTTNANNVVSNVWSTVTSIGQILCIAGIVIIGLKYMLSPADKKADIKNQSVAIVIGLMLATSALPIIQFIVNVGKDFLG